MNYQNYEFAKAFWLKANPNATPAQFEAACKRLAREMGI